MRRSPSSLWMSCRSRWNAARSASGTLSESMYSGSSERSGLQIMQCSTIDEFAWAAALLGRYAGQSLDRRHDRDPDFGYRSRRGRQAGFDRRRPLRILAFPGIDRVQCFETDFRDVGQRLRCGLRSGQQRGLCDHRFQFGVVVAPQSQPEPDLRRRCRGSFTCSTSAAKCRATSLSGRTVSGSRLSGSSVRYLCDRARTPNEPASATSASVFTGVTGPLPAKRSQHRTGQK